MILKIGFLIKGGSWLGENFVSESEDVKEEEEERERIKNVEQRKEVKISIS